MTSTHFNNAADADARAAVADAYADQPLPPNLPADSIAALQRELFASFGFATPQFARECASVAMRSFLARQVEQNLAAAAESIDRCIADRASKRALVKDWFTLWLDELKFKRFKPVREADIVEGDLFKRDRMSAEKKARVQQVIKESSESLAASITKNLTKAEWNDPKATAKWTGSPFDGQNIQEITFRDAWFYFYAKQVQMRGLPEHAVPGGDAWVDFGIELATWAAERERDIQAVQSLNAQNLAKSASASHELNDLEMKWGQRDISSSEDQWIIECLIHDLRQVAMASKSGPYNLRDQARALQERIANEFGIAYSRMIAARNGLAEVYGHVGDKPFPELKDGDDREEVLDLALAWTRDVLAWLLAFTQREQVYVLALSLRSAVGEAAWSSFKKQPADKAGWKSLSFPLGSAKFEGQSHVRLRGINAYTVSDKMGAYHGMWRASLRPPIQTARLYREGPAIAAVDKRQDEVLPCYLGRVRERSLNQSSEFNAMGSLFNLSPITPDAAESDENRWRLLIGEASTAGYQTADLLDIEVELMVAMNPGPTA